METSLAPGGCCSLSIRSRYVLPRQLVRLIGSLPHHRNNLCPFDVVAKRFVVRWERSTFDLLDCSHGIFLITTAHAYEGLLLYLATFMSDVVKPYIDQKNDVTSGMSTSTDVSDRKAVTCLSDISATSRWNGFNFPFLKKHDVKARCEVTAGQCMHTKQCFHHPRLFLVQNGSKIRHSDVSSVISGTVVEDDITFTRSSGKPKKNHQDIRVGRPYQYVSLGCSFCIKGDERVSFFVSTLKVYRLSDHPVMFVVALHHHAFSTM